jgi:hypothetical protein
VSARETREEMADGSDALGGVQSRSLVRARLGMKNIVLNVCAEFKEAFSLFDKGVYWMAPTIRVSN